MSWEIIERPGYFGKKRDEIFTGYNEEYGKDNWRIMWSWNNRIIPWTTACHVYEYSYFVDSFNREDMWKELTQVAEDVYDFDESDRKSGLKYTIQESPATHMQDIAIRRVVFARGWEFQGKELVRIRSHEEKYGKLLSPGKVPFHVPNLIPQPALKSWWDPGSVEQWYQSAKVLQKRLQAKL